MNQRDNCCNYKDYFNCTIFVIIIFIVQDIHVVIMYYACDIVRVLKCTITQN